MVEPMLVSRCCKKPVFVMVDYYVCGQCHFCCDAVDVSVKEYHYDARGQTEAQDIVGYA